MTFSDQLLRLGSNCIDHIHTRMQQQHSQDLQMVWLNLNDEAAICIRSNSICHNIPSTLHMSRCRWGSLQYCLQVNRLLVEFLHFRSGTELSSSSNQHSHCHIHSNQTVAVKFVQQTFIAATYFGAYTTLSTCIAMLRNLKIEHERKQLVLYTDSRDNISMRVIYAPFFFRLRSSRLPDAAAICRQHKRKHRRAAPQASCTTTTGTYSKRCIHDMSHLSASCGLTNAYDKRISMHYACNAYMTALEESMPWTIAQPACGARTACTSYLSWARSQHGAVAQGEGVHILDQGLRPVVLADILAAAII